MLHYGPLVLFHFAVEHMTYPIWPTVTILKNNIQSMGCETSAQYNLSQRPPPHRRQK